MTIVQMRVERHGRFMSLCYMDYVDAQKVVRNTPNSVPEIEVATREIVDVDERMNQYLDDQSSISGLSM